MFRPAPEQEAKKMFEVPTIDLIRTGENIARLRIQAGLSVRDLQKIFGFSTPQALYKWQRGTALPAMDNMVVLAAVFGVKIDDILVISQRSAGVSA